MCTWCTATWKSRCDQDWHRIAGKSSHLVWLPQAQWSLQGRNTQSIRVLSLIWKRRHEANTNLPIAHTHVTPVPTWIKKNPQAEDRQSGGIFPTQLLPSWHMFAYKSSKDSDTVFCFRRAFMPLFLPLFKMAHSLSKETFRSLCDNSSIILPLGVLCQHVMALNSFESKAFLCEIMPCD